MKKLGLLAPESPTKPKSKRTKKNTPIKDLSGYYVVNDGLEYDLENDFHEITDEQAEQDRLASARKK
jgi:hypothetical protein